MNDMASSADHAEALLAARRGRNFLTGLLLFLLLAQLALFFTARYSQILATTMGSTTQPSSVRIDLLHYAISLSGFVGLVSSLLLSAVLLLVINIMLVSRSLGLGPVVRAFLMSLVLLLLLFPWQAFLNNATLTATEFKIPGVLYTWEEISRHARFVADSWTMRLLRWSRFVGFPVVAMVLLTLIIRRSSKGIRLALGEEKSPLTAVAPPPEE